MSTDETQPKKQKNPKKENPCGAFFGYIWSTLQPMPAIKDTRIEQLRTRKKSMEPLKKNHWQQIFEYLKSTCRPME